MSDVVEFVEDLGGAIVDIVEDVGGALVDAVEGVGGALVDAVEWVVDEVVDPVMTTVTGVIESALDNPIKTIAQIYATITPGMQWMLPLIEGADVALSGGDIGDVLEATAKAYVIQEASSYVGKEAGSYAGEAAKGAEFTAANQKLVADAVTQGVQNATIAVVQGQDPLKALVTGGISAGTAAALGQIDGFSTFAKNNPAAAGAIANGLGAALSGGNVTQATIMGAIHGAELVKDVIKEFDPKNGTAEAKMTPAQTAIVSDILMGTANAAISGGNPSNVIRAALLKAGSKAVGDMVTGAFKDSTNAASTAYEKVASNSEAIEKNQASQEGVAADYNNLKAQLDIRIAEQSRLNDAANSARDAYYANKTQANYDAAIAAKNAAESYTTALNKDYGEFFKPHFDTYSTQLATLQAEHTKLVTGYSQSMDTFKAATDKLTAAADAAYFTSSRAFVEAMDPNFNADQYRKLNGLGDGVDVYEHYLSDGQFKGLPTNNESAKALVTGDVTGAAVSKPTESVAPDKVFDGSKFGSTAAAQKAAVKNGMDYFTAPDGNTYKILSDTEAKDKIKSAATFGEAFTMARKTLGSGATFEWTNPDTGKTSSFTTQTKEEAAASANAGSLVKVNDAVTNYVTDKILSNVTDYKNFNPADLTKAEYKQFIGAYLNATDSQRQQMLKGADQMTFGVIANVLKEAPEAIKTKGTAFSVVPTGEIKASDYTNIFGTIKTGMNMAAADLAGVGVRTAQWVGDALGADTSTLTKMQDILAKGKDTDMSKLVGMERPVAAGIASLVESFGSFYVGGPVTSLITNGAIAANNAWVEGGSAVISTSRFSEGNSYSSAEEAEKNGVFAYRKLTTQENALRTAAMASMEVAFEKLGIPGMNKIMQGVPLTGGTDAFVEGIRRNAAGMLTEQSTEIATTVAQLTFDKVSSFGLAQNATFADYARSVGDTIVSVAVTVGGSTSAATLLNNVRNASTVLRDESSIGVTPLTYNSVVAKDATGQNVTLAELLTANSIANFDDPTANADLAKLTPVADLRSVVNLGDMNVTLGDLLSGTQAVASTTDVLTESAVASIFRASDFVPDDNTVKGFVGAPASATTFTNISKFVDNNKLDAKEAIEVAKKEGITLTEAQAQQYVQQGDEAALSAALAANLDPTSTTYEEAKAFFTQRGYVPTFDEVNQFVGAKAESDQSTAVGAYVNPRQVTTEEAEKYFKDIGYKPTDAEVNQFVGQVNEQEQAAKIATYVDPRMVDEGEVKAAYDVLGLKKPTADDVKKLLGQYDEAGLTAKATEYLPTARYNAIMAQLDEMSSGGISEEAKAAIDLVRKDLTKSIADTGLEVAKVALKVDTAKADLEKAITDLSTSTSKDFASLDKAIQDLSDAGLTVDDVRATVDKIVGSAGTDKSAATGVYAHIDTKLTGIQTELAQTEKDILAEVAKNEAAGLARDTAIQKAINTVAATQKTDTATLTSKISGLGTTLSKEIAGVQAELAQTEKDILAQVALNEKAGMTRDAALQKAINTVAATQKTDTATLTSKISGLSTALGKEIDAVQADLAQTEKDILAQVAINEKAGMTRDAALQKAINTVAAAQKTDTATLTSKIAGVQTALGTEIKTLQSSLDKTKTDILAQVAKNEQAGMTRDAALQKAISDVAATQKTDTASLLTRLGTTEANLKAQFATQISGLDTKLTAAIADAKASGLAGDAALKAAIDKVAADQGTTAANLLAKIGTTEAALKSQFATQIAGVQTQIGNVQASLTKAIADAQAAGLQGDAALQAAIDKVAGNLGTTKADLLAQMGTTEAQLRQDFATQIGAVQQQVTDVQKAITDQMAAYEKAGLARDDALSLAITTVADSLGTTKANLLTQIGTTEANLKAQITGISADVQAKYDTLTAEQKALAAQLQQQGVDLNTAIQQAQQQTQTQISGLTQDVQTKYDTLTQGQKDLATQLQQQGFDLNTAIQLARSESAAGFKDVFGQMAANQAATKKAIADAQAAAAADAEKTRQAQAAAALKTQRMGNLNSMMGMLMQAPDVGGQQVTVKAPDPAKIGYIYDWSSIFANPSQEKMFASPYGGFAKGGAVRSEVDDVNDELLKLLRG